MCPVPPKAHPLEPAGVSGSFRRMLEANCLAPVAPNTVQPLLSWALANCF